MTNEKKLEQILDDIWRKGDRDEMSIKHIGHGVAALVAFGDWTKGADYNMPDYLETEAERKQLLKQIEPIWAQAKAMRYELGRDAFLEVVSNTKFGFYPTSYLESDWLPYAEEMN